jgi:hypothetical protein
VYYIHIHIYTYIEYIYIYIHTYIYIYIYDRTAEQGKPQRSGSAASQVRIPLGPAGRRRRGHLPTVPGPSRPPMDGQSWASWGDPGSGPKKSKNKLKQFDASPKRPQNIDADLRGHKKLLERRISFVPAKKAENGDMAAALAEVGAGGARTAHVRQDVRRRRQAMTGSAQRGSCFRRWTSLCIPATVRVSVCRRAPVIYYKGVYYFFILNSKLKKIKMLLKACACSLACNGGIFRVVITF